ncbi:MAG TPA: hypothetical protein VKY85_01785 [Candidatus Angelobacter sp.]|nr:hypothetical protein [Candidatus Angelobacter sp.]
MKRTLWLIAGMAMLVAFAGSSIPFSPVPSVVQAATPTTPVYVMQSTTYGVFAVNESTGAVTFCANTTMVPGASGGQAPIGACKSLGKVAPTTMSNNSLSLTVSGISVFVFNNQTGVISQCGGSGVVSGSTVNPVASCKVLPNLN